MHTEVKKVYQCLSNADKDDNKIRRLLNKKFFGVSGSFMKIGSALLVLLFVSIVSAFLASKFDIYVLRVTALIALVVYYFLCMWLMFGDFLVNYKAVFKSLANPLFVVFENSRICAASDKILLQQLKNCSQEALIFVKLELSVEADAFNKRMALIVGVMEKVGVLPGLISLYALIYKLNEDLSGWAYSFVYALAVLYFLSLGAHLCLLKVERYIRLLDIAVEDGGVNDRGANP